RAHYDVGMSADIFRHGMHHNISTQVQRGLKIWRCKGVIHCEKDLRLFGDIRNSLYIYNLKRRISRSLHPDEPRFVVQVIPNYFWIRKVHKMKLDSIRLK